MKNVLAWHLAVRKISRYDKTHAKASDCIECRSCEGHCPQHLTIVDYLKTVAKTFED